MRRLRTISLLAAAGLIAGGCGGGSSHGGTATRAAVPRHPKATAKTPSRTQIRVSPTKSLSTMPVIPAQSGPPPGRLVTDDIVRGHGAVVRQGDVITVQYVGARWPDGAVFDSSWSRHQPFSTPLDAQHVIPGWVQGLAGMRVGGRRQLVIPPTLGYGPQGQPPVIAPDETLIFVVDVLRVSH